MERIFNICRHRILCNYDIRQQVGNDNPQPIIGLLEDNLMYGRQEKTEK